MFRITFLLVFSYAFVLHAQDEGGGTGKVGWILGDEGTSNTELSIIFEAQQKHQLIQIQSESTSQYTTFDINQNEQLILQWKRPDTYQLEMTRLTKTYLQQTVQGNIGYIDLSPLPNGTYEIILKAENQRYTYLLTKSTR